MAWIKTPAGDEAQRQQLAAVRALYPQEYREAVPGLPEGPDDGIMASHNLLPRVQYHIFAAHASMMAGDLPLTRSQHEMIATLVSVLNRCFY